MTLVSALRIPVRAGAEDDFVRAFAGLRIFEHSRRSGGFRGGRLLRPLAAGEPFLVVAEWVEADAYQGWLDNPARDELKATLEPLLAGELLGGVYEDAS